MRCKWIVLQLSDRITEVNEELQALQKIAISKDRVVSLEKALHDGIGTLRHALGGKVCGSKIPDSSTAMRFSGRER